MSAFLRADFDVRVQEIEKYFNFLKCLEDDVKFLSNHDNTHRLIIDDDQSKIFKANGIMLLYNLIESTILNSVVTIFDEIQMKSLSYSQVTEKIKKYWFKYKYKHDESIKEDSLYNRFYTIVEDIITNVALDLIDKLEYGGSIDARRIKDIADSLGADFVDPAYDKDKHGKTLLEIKAKRNLLAHGNESFASIGKNITYYGVETTHGVEVRIDSFGLRHFQMFTIEHLEKYIDCIEDFISNEKYKIAI